MKPVTVEEYLGHFTSKNPIISSWDFALTHEPFVAKALTLDYKKLTDVAQCPDPSKLLNELTRDEIMAHIPLASNYIATWKLVNEFDGDVPSHLRFFNQHKGIFETVEKINSPTADIYFSHNWISYRCPRWKSSPKQNYSTGTTGFGYIKDGKLELLLELEKRDQKWIPIPKEGCSDEETSAYLVYNSAVCGIERIKRAGSPEAAEVDEVQQRKQLVKELLKEESFTKMPF